MFTFVKVVLSLVAAAINTFLWTLGALTIHLLIVNFMSQNDAITGMNRGGNVFAFAAQARRVVPVSGDITDYLIVGLIFSIGVLIAGIRAKNYSEMGFKLLSALGGSAIICGILDVLFSKIFVREDIETGTKISLSVGLVMIVAAGLLFNIRKNIKDQDDKAIRV